MIKAVFATVAVFVSMIFVPPVHIFFMVNQVTVKLKTTKGDWETTFQKSTRVKDVILALKVHFRLPKDSKC